MPKAIKNFPFSNKRVEMAKYKNMRSNLDEHEIDQIYQTFQIYNPKNGFVKTEDILKKYENTSDCGNLKE